MTSLLIDTSVLLKWFHSDGESEVLASRSIRDAARDGEIQTHVIDLGLYEVGNVLLRSLGWNGTQVADQLEDLILICGVPLTMTARWLREAAEFGERYKLTYYDAAWGAVAASLGISLVSVDRQLLATGVAESPAVVAGRLGLPC
ncbi:MAG: type II toxin-antitoxin system VapC family toxin [Acidimicrobiales bacterium]